MSTFTNRKNKINLTDYNFQRDIENRLLMAELSFVEVDVLQEIINGSLKTSIQSIADNLNINPKNLKIILDKLKKSHLFQIQGDTVLVDKEMRKYYESQIIKFDDDFKPDMEYLIGLLNKVPIHALPTWYAIPRSSDNIFQSIIEKFLITPKTYERYLQDISFDNPLHTSIVKEVFAAPDYKLKAQTLLEKFKLSREQFEEHMLFLEFSLVCCISYHKTEDHWEEVVMPFHEWRELLLFIQNSKPSVIKDFKSIEPIHKEDFGFLIKLNEFVQNLINKPFSIKEAPSELLETASSLNLAKQEKQKITSTSLSKEWLEKPLIDQAIFLYRQTLNRILSDKQTAEFSEKDFREVEKSLKRLSHGGWVYFDDFIKGSLAAVGNTQPVYLHNKGKRWKYMTPCYNENELQFIQLICCKYLAQAGMISTGLYKDKLCLCLTSFGRHSLV